MPAKLAHERVPQPPIVVRKKGWNVFVSSRQNSGTVPDTFSVVSAEVAGVVTTSPRRASASAARVRDFMWVAWCLK